MGGATSFIAASPTAFQKNAASSLCGTEQLSPFQSPTPINCAHAYLQKQNAAGEVLYATYLSGNSQDGVTAITTDARGNVYATGYTYSSDFPVTVGAFQAHYAGPTTPYVTRPLGAPFGPATVEPGGDAFVAKFANDGTLLFATLLGGAGGEIPTLIAVDSSGSVCVAGLTTSSDFPLTAGAASRRQGDYFFARLNASGNTLTYSTYSTPSIVGFDFDSAGRAFLTGGTVAGGTAAGAPYVSVLDFTSGAFTTPFTGTTPGAGAAVAYTAGRVFLALSPAPLLSGYAQPVLLPVRRLGASSLVQLSPDAAKVLSETDMASTQFDSIQQDSAGNIYAFGHGTGALPATLIQPLATPCGTGGRSFVLELNPAGSLTTATYFRQGSDSAAAVASPGNILTYRNKAIPTFDISKSPAANFGCPRNLASNLEGPGVAPGEIFVISGVGIGPTQAAIGAPDSTGHYPTSLGGAQVTFGGIAVPLLYAQANEIHAVAPFSLSRTPTIQILYGAPIAPPLDAGFSTVSPGIFEANGQGAIINQDGTVNSPSNPAPLGSIVSIYATGTGSLSGNAPDGTVTPLPPPFITTRETPKVTFAGVEGTTRWSGSAPQLIFGVTQINVQLPSSLPQGTNLARVPVVLNEFVEYSAAVSISVK